MENNFVFIKIGRTRHQRLFLNEVLYFKAIGSYTLIQMENNKIIASKNLKAFVNLVDNENFIRVNRSYFINLNKCIEINTSQNAELILCNGEKITPSKKYITNLKLKLGIN